MSDRTAHRWCQEHEAEVLPQYPDTCEKWSIWQRCRIVDSPPPADPEESAAQAFIRHHPMTVLVEVLVDLATSTERPRNVLPSAAEANHVPVTTPMQHGAHTGGCA